MDDKWKCKKTRKYQQSKKERGYKSLSFCYTSWLSNQFNVMTQDKQSCLQILHQSIKNLQNVIASFAMLEEIVRTHPSIGIGETEHHSRRHNQKEKVRNR